MPANAPRRDWLESRIFQAAAGAAVCLYAANQLLAALAVPLGRFDDAIPLVGADLINHGRLPSLDFSTVYPALLIYLLAALFRVFGPTVLVYRALCGLLYLAVLIAANRFYKDRAAHLRPLAPLMTLLFALGIGSSIQNPWWPGFALSILAVLVYLRAERPDRYAARIAFAGMLAGVSTLIRFNFGVYVAAIVAADLLVHEWLATPSLRAIRWKRLFLNLAAFCLPLLLVNAVFYWSVYGTQSILALSQTLAAGRSAIGEARFIHLPLSIFTIEVIEVIAWPCVWFSLRIAFGADRLPGRALMPLAAALLLIVLALGMRSQPSVSLLVPALCVVTVVALNLWVERLDRSEFCLLLYHVCLLHFYLSRADLYHVRPLFILLAAVIPFLVLRSKSGQDGNPGAFPTRGVAFVALAAALWIVGTKPESLPHASLVVSGTRLIRSGGLNLRQPDADRLPAGQPQNPWRSIYPEMPKETRDASYLDEAEAARFLRARTAPAEPIFVGVKDHSRVNMSNVRLYWLTGRMPGSRYIQLDAGVASRESVQQEIIADLDRNRVTWAILEDTTGMDTAYEATVRPGSTALDNYLASSYRKEASFGGFSLLKRNSPMDATKTSADPQR